MNNEEAKHDINEFNNLKNQLDSLWKELEKDNDDENPLFSGNDKSSFIEALDSASKLVKDITPYFDDLEEQIKCYECDYSDKRKKETKKIINEKKEVLDDIAEQVEDLIEHPHLSNLFLEITLRCNARCEHCGSSCGEKIPKDEISAEDLKRTLLEIHNKYGAENVFLTVTGGEPLMRKDLFDIMKYAVSLGFRWGMATNAMLITEEVVEKLRETNFESISISLDGLKDTHDSFRKVPGGYDKVMKAIKMLQNLETLRHLQVTTVANKKNLHELEEIYQILLKLGIKEWRVMCVDPIGRANLNDGILLDKEGLLYMFNFIKEKRIEGKMLVEDDCAHYLGLKYENILRNHGFVCGAGLFVGSILANGDICVCPNVRRKELVQGNIKTDSFIDVWENKFQKFRKNRITTNEKCKKCKSYKYCRGGSFHTWNFDDNIQNMCMKKILGKEFIE